MKFKKYFPLFALVSYFSVNAQVGIGTTTPQAALEIKSSNQGILVPRVALNSTSLQNPIINPDGSPIVKGTLVFNTQEIADVTEGFYYWNGSKWIALQGSVSEDTSDKNTLDKAYDQGGPGAGRIITADSGPVQINVAGSNQTGLRVDTNVANSYAIYAEQNSVGTTIRAANTYSGNNQYSTIQGRNNSSNSTSSAILGLSGGAGYAVIGQTDTSSSARAAVYGNNTRTNGGHGVIGFGYNGVVGETNYRNGYGVWGQNYNSIGDGNGIGTYGRGFVGLWGDLLSGGYSAYLNGRVFTTVGYYSPSDIRLKSNIKKIDHALDKIKDLSGNYYTIKFEVKKLDIHGNEKIDIIERQEYGLLAQELENKFPEMLTDVTFDFTKDDATKYKAVNYNQMIPVLLQAINELNDKISDLEKKLNK